MVCKGFQEWECRHIRRIGMLGHSCLFGPEEHIIEEESRRHKQTLEKNYTLYIKFSIILYDQGFTEGKVSKTAVDSLKPGMVLAKPVVNKNGLVMVSEGTELNDSLIGKIREMDVPGVYVRGMTQPDTPKEDMLALLDKRFNGVEEKPYMALIKQALKEHIEELYG
ncbi:MAG: hypothetical protein A4E62_01242 [Syntrophorhabdus sp. PtaU1.Bin002]|nr:MAG: hypothetical protein A4E62_01242 [Syntrophorhabdus sp. PtaU1.Bin002]